MWEYSDLIQALSSVYCVDHIAEDILNNPYYCLNSPQLKLLSTSFATDSMCQQRQMLQEDNSDCHSKISKPKTSQKKPQRKFFERETMSEDSEEYMEEQNISRKPKSKRRKFDIREDLLKLRSSILNEKITEFPSTQKKAKSANKKHLKRRSEYIGVSRNNSNWQALINVNKAKKYIGTFADEIQAARAYDLFSVAVRGEDASLNFDYSAEEMLEKIEHYLQHGNPKVDS
ncbi:unnamed protein product [Moneuplotes crassus]|uniref:AP2/ERF domain-containing protein n=1 Tax=Euplotes crassus TaxID=5936 RepID=A0AAD1XY16_EUPCR|nr:unnamed protein product [Moneuplotes crassus]